LIDFETFEEVEDDGQKTVGSRWVITKKENMMAKRKIIRQELLQKVFSKRSNLR
jgi:hypothetical protein